MGAAKTYSGDTTVEAGMLQLTGTTNLLPSGAGKGNVIVNTGATLDMAGNSHTINGLSGGGTVTTTANTARTLTVGNGAASGDFSGTLTQGAAQTLHFTKIGAGTQTLAGNLAHRGVTTVNGGRLVVGANMTATSAVNITAGATLEVAPSATRVVRTPTVSITGDGRLDLTNNKLLTDTSAGGFNGTNYTGIQGEVQRAYNFGAWDMPGLTTSQELAGQNAGPLSGTTTIGVATAEQVLFIAPSETGTFMGQSVTGATTIAMYTYAGDLNFDGLVDGADYGVIDNSVQFPGTDGYANGDFNYDGIIDGADYGIIDNTIQLQGAPIPTTASSSLESVTAVPEPSACGFAILAAGALLRRRCRRRTAPSPL
jgi:autotransporter-associated beta strand protein